MDDGLVAQVRRFHRSVTQRIGVLEDDYLHRGRPLGEARVLWEIGPDGCDVRALRTRLGLDSGYLSRLLRSLEADGLVAVDARPTDRRVRHARLTAAGRRERAVLDRRSDELAWSCLAPLAPEQREQLVGAMAQVERLLTAGLVEVRPTDPADPTAVHCLREYFTELNQRFDAGFDPARSLAPDAGEFRPPTGLFLVATLRGEPVGCGALKFHDVAPPDIKRMWVSASARGLGIGRRLLQELEAVATTRSSVVRLETNRALREAISMYRSAGYVEIEAFNDEAYAHHWFEKRLRPVKGARGRHHRRIEQRHELA
jgi:DNA-binding MarR family transcriptional regulator/GNAT superfamily N-acetyltransferase